MRKTGRVDCFMVDDLNMLGFANNQVKHSKKTTQTR